MSLILTRNVNCNDTRHTNKQFKATLYKNVD